MELVVVLLYLVGVVLTARHRIYRTKLRNEGRELFGIQLEPRVYSTRDYEQLKRQALGEDARDPVKKKWLEEQYGYVISDRVSIASDSLFFPVYWTLAFASALGKVVLSTVFLKGVKKTPGEVERERKEQQDELDRLYRATERYRREQDG